MQAVVGREIKKRQDAQETYRKAGREELAGAEASAITVLQGYLPPQLDREDARARVAEIIAEQSEPGQSPNPSDMMRVMPVVMERLRGQVDGRSLNELVRELLSC